MTHTVHLSVLAPQHFFPISLPPSLSLYIVPGFTLATECIHSLKWLVLYMVFAHLKNDLNFWQRASVPIIYNIFFCQLLTCAPLFTSLIQFVTLAHFWGRSRSFVVSIFSESLLLFQQIRIQNIRHVSLFDARMEQHKKLHLQAIRIIQSFERYFLVISTVYLVFQNSNVKFEDFLAQPPTGLCFPSFSSCDHLVYIVSNDHQFNIVHVSVCAQTYGIQFKRIFLLMHADSSLFSLKNTKKKL